MDGLVCWRCGAALRMPLNRLDECSDCHAELHVCRQCEFYDERLAERCSEERADPPLEKQRANFCDYFRPGTEAYRGRTDESAARAARAQLEELFGAPSPLHQQERPPDEKELSETERARRELERLFGPKDG